MSKISVTKRRAAGLVRRLRMSLDALTMKRPLDTTGEDEFLEEVYQQLLGRPPEPAGREHYLRKFADGYSRSEMIISLARSDEYARRISARLNPLPNITELRPNQYRSEKDLDSDEMLNTFVVESEKDFDWLEDRIFEYGYYERPGVWSTEINLDKRAMAEMIACLRPKSTLEIGCANGAMMRCLADLGVDVNGVDISKASRDAAPEEMKPRIHLANLEHEFLDLQVDVVYGLDIFEHINPNRIDVFMKSCLSHIKPGGLFFTNTPAYGEDTVFGTAFNIFLDSWKPEIEEGMFTHLVTDESGFPWNGHLIWATARWWDEKFRSFGLTREVELEEALHRRYDPYINETSVARRAIFIYSTGVRPDTGALVSGIENTSSRVLEEYKASRGN